jgi:hypothetical protein
MSWFRLCGSLVEDDKKTLSKKLGNEDDFSSLSNCLRGKCSLSALVSGKSVAENVLGLSSHKAGSVSEDLT